MSPPNSPRVLYCSGIGGVRYRPKRLNKLLVVGGRSVGRLSGDEGRSDNFTSTEAGEGKNHVDACESITGCRWRCVQSRAQGPEYMATSLRAGETFLPGDGKPRRKRIREVNMSTHPLHGTLA